MCKKMVVLAVVPHQLTKIRAQNRVRLVKAAFLLSAVAVAANISSVCTNSWLHTSEVLKYFVFPNQTDHEEQNPAPFFKNATLGPLLFCWSDPLTEFHCSQVEVFTLDDPSDVTTAVELSVRRCVPLMVSGCALDCVGLLSLCLCLLRRNPYRSLFVAIVTNISAGLANFALIIIYMSSVSKEVGNKIYKASEIDDSLFHYSYGFSFVLLKVSFLCTESAAMLSVLVFMSKRDERTYNWYRMAAMLRTIPLVSHFHSPSADQQQDGRQSPLEHKLAANERYFRHTRMNTLRRASRNMAVGDVKQLESGHYWRMKPSPPAAANGMATNGPIGGVKKVPLPRDSNPFLLNVYSLADIDYA